MRAYHLMTRTVQAEDKVIFPKPNETIWYSFEKDNNVDLTGWDIHPLAKRRFLEFGGLPRIYIFRDEVVLSLYTMTKNYEMSKVNILIGKNYLLSYGQTEDFPLFEKVVKAIATEEKELLHTGYILYQIFYMVIEEYLVGIDCIAEEMLKIEESIFTNPFSKGFERDIYQWKKKLQRIRQLVEPEWNIITTLVNAKFPFVDEDSGFYFQEIEENYDRIVNALDTFKENMVGILELQMSVKSDWTNDIMTTLALVGKRFR